MNQIEKAISNLSSPDKDTRYKACVELRLADSLPATAITALEAATHDPDPLVADAARRALAYHKAPSTPADQPNVQERQKTNGWAIASFTLGVLGGISPLFVGLDNPLCVCTSHAISIVAIIVGVIAMLKIKKSEPRQKGAGLAIAGIVIGALSIIVFGGLLVYGIYESFLK